MNEHNATEQAYKNGYKKGRAEAIKKFAERLKTAFILCDPMFNRTIDKIVQEMVDQQRKEDEGK